MTRWKWRRERVRRDPWWLLLLPLLLLPVLVGWAVASALLPQADTVDASTAAAYAAKLKAWQLAAAAAVATGGLITLGSVFHRQAVQARAAADVRHDATEKRAQELFLQAVEHLGHEKAAVRVGGLHALNALGQDHPHRRRAVMDVWCAYLRMPPARVGDADEERGWPADERQVRATAQRLIAEHLRDRRGHEERAGTTADASPAPKPFWGPMDVDLSGARLHSVRFEGCRFGSASFEDAEFSGGAGFSGAEFTGDARFNGAKFTGRARFDGATFAGDVAFHRATFTDRVDFDHATFVRPGLVDPGARLFLVFKHRLPAGLRAAPRDGEPGRVLERDPALLEASPAEPGHG